jgi:hypothetical protein
MTLIHKSISPFGDWIIFMNGVPIYKKWPTGRSLVFEKYGINTDNRDRDNGHYGGTPQRQKETSAVEANPYRQRAPETLRVAEKVYDTVGGFSPIWLTYLNDGKAADAEVAASETVRVPPEGYEGLPEDIVEIATALGDNPEIAHVLNAERQHWQAEIERLRKAADYISPYLRYTVGEESPGHHPTMPSAVAAFHVAFDIDTQEKRVARIRAALKKGQD